MSIEKGYVPHIHKGADGGTTNERLRDDDDSFPYIDDEDISSTESFFEYDRVICQLIYAGLSLRDQVQLYTNINTGLESRGFTLHMRSYSSIILDKNITSAEEALTETQAALVKIFVKISEYIFTVRAVFEKWLRASADLQKRSAQHLATLAKSNIEFSNTIYDINQSGCPSYKQLYTVLTSSYKLISILGNIDQNNTPLVFLAKFNKLINELSTGTAPTDTKFEEMITSDIVFDNLPELQELLSTIGVTFDGSEAASFKDILSYEQHDLRHLGYTDKNIFDLIKSCPSSESISKCNKLLIMLQSLHDLFKNTKRLDSLDETSVEKFKSILENLPNILTLVVSIYRSSVVSARYYTTIVQDILASVVNDSSRSR